MGSIEPPLRPLKLECGSRSWTWLKFAPFFNVTVLNFYVNTFASPQQFEMYAQVMPEQLFCALSTHATPLNTSLSSPLIQTMTSTQTTVWQQITRSCKHWGLVFEMTPSTLTTTHAEFASYSLQIAKFIHLSLLAFHGLFNGLRLFSPLGLSVMTHRWCDIDPEPESPSCKHVMWASLS